ncbi:hypothetical protein NECAME_12123 [Necator americanus]|uniref:Uncharacterized protein n=1 Tax=Necator americanus TaxID=51031 RepID=W2T4C1_NECAM|nr:hypothetical protein NECAME_12123 [Necator americanus]ETN75797.1 hypothetical protein NECAME_12123 [Necator americanus]
MVIDDKTNFTVQRVVQLGQLRHVLCVNLNVSVIAFKSLEVIGGGYHMAKNCRALLPAHILTNIHACTFTLKNSKCSSAPPALIPFLSYMLKIAPELHHYSALTHYRQEIDKYDSTVSQTIIGLVSRLHSDSLNCIIRLQKRLQRILDIKTHIDLTENEAKLHFEHNLQLFIYMVDHRLRTLAVDCPLQYELITKKLQLLLIECGSVKFGKASLTSRTHRPKRQIGQSRTAASRLCPTNGGNLEWSP